MSQRPRGQKRDKLESEKSLHFEKIWESEESNQKNIVMSEEFVKSSVMSAKIDANVVVELSIFKIGGWNNLQPRNQNLSA